MHTINVQGRERAYGSIHSQLRQQMEQSGQLQATTVSASGKTSLQQLIGGWVSPGAGLDDFEKK